MKIVSFSGQCLAFASQLSYSTSLKLLIFGVSMFLQLLSFLTENNPSETRHREHGALPGKQDIPDNVFVNDHVFTVNFDYLIHIKFLKC